ncbi:ImmA/IrrE family metallo-endopeptidase [Rhizobium daejeonense]
MARDLYISRALSAATIANLAKATRTLCDLSDNDDFDIVRFLESGIYKIVPDFYLFIESDEKMNGSKAFVTSDSLGIVVAESVYNDACSGLFYAKKILAHEFGHVLLHHNRNFETKHFTHNGYTKQISNTEEFHSAEWQADTFAITLIIQPNQVKSDTTIEKFSKKYNMSKKQADFVINRLNSIRRRGGSSDRTAVKTVIDEFLVKRKAQQTKPRQLSLFQ